MPPRSAKVAAAQAEVRYPDPARSIEQQDDLILLAMLVFGEARGAKLGAKLGVAHVVRNRVRCSTPEFGLGYREVILRPYQFSCFLSADANRAKLLSPLDFDGSGPSKAGESAAVWAECYDVARQVYAQVDAIGATGRAAAGDPTAGATHYFDASLDARPPKWAKQFTATVRIGRLRFFREVRHKISRERAGSIPAPATKTPQRRAVAATLGGISPRGRAVTDCRF